MKDHLDKAKILFLAELLEASKYLQPNLSHPSTNFGLMQGIVQYAWNRAKTTTPLSKLSFFKTPTQQPQTAQTSQPTLKP